MSDRVAVMFGGRIAQVAAPREIYNAPASREVAEFLGGMNFLAGSVRQSGQGKVRVETALAGVLEVAGRARPGAAVSLGIRPERLRLLGAREKAPIALSGKIADKVFFGEVTHYTVSVAEGQPPLTLAATGIEGGRDPAIGSRVRIGIDPSALVLLA